MALPDVKILVRLSRRGINMGQMNTEGSDSIDVAHTTFTIIPLVYTIFMQSREIMQWALLAQDG